jgi:hypothetical protein
MSFNVILILSRYTIIHRHLQASSQDPASFQLSQCKVLTHFQFNSRSEKWHQNHQ